MRVSDVVEIRGLEGAQWEDWNDSLGVVEWCDNQEARVQVTSDEILTVAIRYLTPTHMNVAYGAPVSAVGLSASDWRPLNDTPGEVVGGIDEHGRIPIRFPAPWGTVPLLLQNLAASSEARMHSAQHKASTVDHSGIAFMFKEGTLVEAHNLTSAQWAPLNGVTGIVCGQVVQEADTLRVPVAFCDPWGDLPMLVSNLKSADNARYVTLTRTDGDPTQGMTLEGTRVTAVRRNSPAEEAGVRPGEVIRAVSNVAIFRGEEAFTALDRPPRGTMVLITLQTSHPTYEAYPSTRRMSGRSGVGDYLSLRPGESLRRASPRCPDCGGSVALERRCPTTGEPHGAGGRSVPKPRISRTGSGASVLSQLADAIQIIDERTSPTSLSRKPIPPIAPNMTPAYSPRGGPPVPPLRTGKPLYLV